MSYTISLLATLGWVWTGLFFTAILLIRLVGRHRRSAVTGSDDVPHA